MKQITTSNNKNIYVFDNMFELNDRNQAYGFAKNSYFRLGWKDGISEETVKYEYIHSKYSQEDLEKLRIYHKMMNCEIGEFVKDMTLSKAMLNLSTPSDVNFIHAHPEDIVILYYVNLEWQNGWHGETLFYDETFSNVEFASPYTPGRVVIFDGRIPHTIRPQSHIASNYRFTLALTYKK